MICHDHFSVTISYCKFQSKICEISVKIIKFWTIKKFINALIYLLSNQKSLTAVDHGQSPTESIRAYNFRFNRVALENYLDQS